MLFWLFVIILVAATVIIFLNDKTSINIPILAMGLSVGACLIAGVVVFSLTVAIYTNHIDLDDRITEKQARYEFLVSQVETYSSKGNFYCEYCLSAAVFEWNEMVNRDKEVYKDFWIGIFYPNELYESFEVIEME